MSYSHCTFSYSLSAGSPLLFAQTQAATAQPASSSIADQGKELKPEDRDAGFVADQGGSEQTSGEVLLIEAYAAIWILVFAMIFMSLRKQQKLDERIQQLAADLEKAREGGDS